MGLISTLLGEDKKKQEPKKEKRLLDVLTDNKRYKDPDYTDDELNEFGLTDWEKDEVKKGNQDPWDFEEDDQDEDSYYNEDDD